MGRDGNSHIYPSFYPDSSSLLWPVAPESKVSGRVDGSIYLVKTSRVVLVVVPVLHLGGRPRYTIHSQTRRDDGRRNKDDAMCNYDARISRAIIVAFFPRREQIASLDTFLSAPLSSQSSSSALPLLSAFGSENGNEPSSKKSSSRRRGKRRAHRPAHSHSLLLACLSVCVSIAKDSKFSYIFIVLLLHPPSFQLSNERRARPPGLALWMRMPWMD